MTILLGALGIDRIRGTSDDEWSDKGTGSNIIDAWNDDIHAIFSDPENTGSINVYQCRRSIPSLALKCSSGVIDERGNESMLIPDAWETPEVSLSARSMIAKIAINLKGGRTCH